MAYQPTPIVTTAYSTSSNPAVLAWSAIGIGRGSTALTGNNRQEWVYNSTNLTTDISAAANQPFFTDGFYLGMRPGDLVVGTQYTSAGATGATGVITFQASVIAVTTAGASVSTGSMMTSTFN